MSKGHIIVIGSGAAGMMAAGTAAENGCSVKVLEKMKRPGRKLSITGKGRCNITNVAEISDFIDRFGESGKFLHQAFSCYFNQDLIYFLESTGLKLVTERGGRVFPASGRAPEVTEAFHQWLRNNNVSLRTSSRVSKIVTKNGRVHGVTVKGRLMECDAVILAAGGASYPLTGSTGDGYKLAESLGHSIVAIRPALVPLETEGDFAGRMKDLNLRNINVKMFVNGRKTREEFGELVFESFGVTGPVTLKLSRDAVDALKSNKKVEFSLDLKPALDEKKLDNRLLRDFNKRGSEPIASIMRGLLPKPMVPVCLERTSINRKRMGNNITAEERAKLLGWLKDFRFTITGHRPIDEAIVTAGGIHTSEINPKTMESRIVSGLYIAGEIIDVDADTGGYNLQAAFSTGWLAGASAADAVNS